MLHLECTTKEVFQKNFSDWRKMATEEKIGNFKTEAPGLFCSCGDHPEMGMLKRSHARGCGHQLRQVCGMWPGSFPQKQLQLLELEEQLARLHTQATVREENRLVALGTAKLNYLDPRISIAWKWFSNIWPLGGLCSVTLCGCGSLEGGLSGWLCVLRTKEAKEEAS